jgi:hypothetical protein
MAGGLNIVARDKDGKIKKDIEITRGPEGKVIKEDELKKKEEKDGNKRRRN